MAIKLLLFHSLDIRRNIQNWFRAHFGTAVDDVKIQMKFAKQQHAPGQVGYNSISYRITHAQLELLCKHISANRTCENIFE